MSTNGEIIIVTFPFSGHVFPATELATLLAVRNYQITLLLPSLPSSPLHPLIRTVQCSSPPPGPPPGHPGPSSSPVPPRPNEGPANGSSTEQLLVKLIEDRDSSSPPLLCVIVDMMIAELIKVCTKHGVLTASLFTASACVAALEHAASAIQSDNVGSDGTIVIPGLPEAMPLTAFNLSSQGGPHMRPPGLGGPHMPPRGHGPMMPPPFYGHSPTMPPPPPDQFGHHGFIPPMAPLFGRDSTIPIGPPGQGQTGGPPAPPAMGLGQTDEAIALLFNTCEDLERPFLEYITKETKKSVLAVGPLLPAQFWSAVTGSTSIVHDESIRSKRDSSHNETDVLNWLDSKLPGSVTYVSFGSGNTPCDAELVELAAGLEESKRPFIWVIQKSAMKHDPHGLPVHEDGPSSFDPNEFAKHIGDKGLVIRGWAPQLMILSHKSIGGFLTHCGWNSTVEALGCGVPMLTWPIHGDQIYNAKLVVNQLKVGHVLKSEGQEAMKKDQVVQGIEKLMVDEKPRERVKALSSEVFGQGIPSSSTIAVDSFLDLIDPNRTK